MSKPTLCLQANPLEEKGTFTGLNYKLTMESGKCFSGQIHHLITLDMWMVFKRNENKLGFGQFLSIENIYKTVCVCS